MKRMMPCSFGFRHNELRIFWPEALRNSTGELVVHRGRIRLALVQLRVCIVRTPLLRPVRFAHVINQDLWLNKVELLTSYPNSNLSIHRV